jgi:hypothetical protein
VLRATGLAQPKGGGVAVAGAPQVLVELAGGGDRGVLDRTRLRALDDRLGRPRKAAGGDVLDPVAERCA